MSGGVVMTRETCIHNLNVLHEITQNSNVFVKVNTKNNELSSGGKVSNFSRQVFNVLNYRNMTNEAYGLKRVATAIEQTITCNRECIEKGHNLVGKRLTSEDLSFLREIYSGMHAFIERICKKNATLNEKYQNLVHQLRELKEIGNSKREEELTAYYNILDVELKKLSREERATLDEHRSPFEGEKSLPALDLHLLYDKLNVDLSNIYCLKNLQHQEKILCDQELILAAEENSLSKEIEKLSEFKSEFEAKIEELAGILKAQKPKANIFSVIEKNNKRIQELALIADDVLNGQPLDSENLKVRQESLQDKLTEVQNQLEQIRSQIAENRQKQSVLEPSYYQNLPSKSLLDFKIDIQNKLSYLLEKAKLDFAGQIHLHLLREFLDQIDDQAIFNEVNHLLATQVTAPFQKGLLIQSRSYLPSDRILLKTAEELNAHAFENEFAPGESFTAETAHLWLQHRVNSSLVVSY